MALLRPILERASRGRVLRRRLPPEVGGQKLFVTPDAALSLWLPGLARTDPLLLRLAAELVHPGAVVWDVGANVGLFAFAASFRAGHSGAVVAIEPDDWLADLLRRSASEVAATSAAVLVLTAAVSDRVGTSDFLVAQRGRAASHLAGVAGSSQAGGARETRQVPTVTLDSLLETYPAPTLVKVDVEGAEVRCLHGASRLLGEVRPIVLCEVDSPNAAAVSEILSRHRYAILDAAVAPATRTPLANAPWNTLAVAEEQFGALAGKPVCPAASASLGAVVTHSDSWPLAVRCVEALRSWGDRLERILLIDDHSSTQPVPLPADPRVSVEVNSARRGFAASLNRGIEEVGTDVVVVFDADAYPLADVSDAVLHAFDSEPRLGLLGFRTMDAEGRESPSWSPPPGAFALVAGQRADSWLRRLLPAREPREVCLHTAALAVRRAAFLSVGGADEALGFLDVDLDLSLRVRRAGWSVCHDPSLVAYHEGGGTPVDTAWRVQKFHRSRFRLLRKHGRIRLPRLLRAAVLARVTGEWLLLEIVRRSDRGRAERRHAQARGRRDLMRLVRRELR